MCLCLAMGGVEQHLPAQNLFFDYSARIKIDILSYDSFDGTIFMSCGNCTGDI